MAVNDIGSYWGGHIDLWATLHRERLPKWLDIRRKRGGNMDFAMWTHKGGTIKGIKNFRVLSGRNCGNSGAFACLVMRHQACEKIVLAGCPMEPIPHFFDDTPWEAATEARKQWLNFSGELAPFVRSMSGWTREMFGAPSRAWLEGMPE